MRLAGVLATLRRNGALARIELAFLLATMVEWGTWLALVVIAYERGGAAEAGVIGFALGIPAVVVAPTAAILGDRWPRSRVLTGTYVGQALALMAGALAFSADAGLAGYGFGVVAMALVALVRPLLASVLPEVARSPEELTAGNVTTGLVEGLGALGGALAAGVLFAIAGGASVLVTGGVAMVVAAILILPLALRARTLELERMLPVDGGLAAIMGAAGRELAAGAATILADRRLAAVTGLMAMTIGVLGALSVLIVIVAIDVLGLEADAAGYLTAVGGLGALLGSGLASGLVGRERLVVPLLGAVVVFGVSVAAVGVSSSPVAVVVALAGTGIGWSIAAVASTTLTQRLAGDDVMTRVFGVNESLQTGSEALSGLLVPILIVAAGPSGALAILGGALIVVVVLAAPTLLRADRVDPTLLRDSAVLRAVPMLGPLSGPVVERLAVGAEHLSVPTGTAIVRESEPGDRFYVITRGRVSVTAHDRDAGELGSGEAFGEIALLRDVPRTATVRALEPTELLAIRRDAFLEALTGQARSRAMASDVVEAHLSHDLPFAEPPAEAAP